MSHNKLLTLFCNRCHKRIIPPTYLKNMNIGGKVKLNCGDTKCKGFATIKPNKTEPKIEEITTQQELGPDCV